MMNKSELVEFATKEGIDGKVHDFPGENGELFFGFKQFLIHGADAWERDVFVEKLEKGWIGYFSQSGKTRILNDNEIKNFVLDLKNSEDDRIFKKYE